MLTKLSTEPGLQDQNISSFLIIVVEKKISKGT